VYRCCPKREAAQYRAAPWAWSERNLASFSSEGPTVSGRIKPDVVAPGAFIAGAHSDGDVRSLQCAYGPGVSTSALSRAALYTLGGTSVSAPLIAGAAALLREYLVRVRGLANPSGYLRKAMLIHAAQRLTGLRTTGPEGKGTELPTQVPNAAYGYGSVNLEKVIPVEDLAVLLPQNQNPVARGASSSSGSNSSSSGGSSSGPGQQRQQRQHGSKRASGAALSPWLIVHDRVAAQFPDSSSSSSSSSNNNNRAAFGLCVHIDPAGASGLRRALRVTVAWYDPPAAPSITGVGIVSNLEVAVLAPGVDPGQSGVGSGVGSGGAGGGVFTPSPSVDGVYRPQQPAAATTTKLVEIDFPRSRGAYRVLVVDRSATQGQVGTAPQRFALVVTGPIVGSHVLEDPFLSACDDASSGLGTNGTTLAGAAPRIETTQSADGTTGGAPPVLIAFAVIMPLCLILAAAGVFGLVRRQQLLKEQNEASSSASRCSSHNSTSNVDGNNDDDGDDDDDLGNDIENNLRSSSNNNNLRGSSSNNNLRSNSSNNNLRSSSNAERNAERNVDHSSGPVPARAFASRLSSGRLSPISIGSRPGSTAALEDFFSGRGGS
jgi:hypothetical protein